jgi:hypothetical protein
VDVCEPPRHLLVMTKHDRQADEQAVGATLTADGDHTILILEQPGRGYLAGHPAGPVMDPDNFSAS